MQVGDDIVDAIRVAVESIDYGQIVINVNSSGKYVEISTLKKERVKKEGDTGAITGKIKAYRTDNS